MLTVIGDDIEKAASLLKAGSLVAIPTETVYGLAALANSEEALEKLYKAKGRPSNHPVIAHIHAPEQMEELALEVPEQARQLARKFWPGPLTMIFKKRAEVSSKITGGQDTIAIRVPDHPLTLALLKALGEPVVAPSANKFGHLSPTEAEHVKNEFEGQVDYILDGGSCDVGIESTILNMTVNPPQILRPGRIKQSDLEEALGIKVESSHSSSPSSRVRVPGALPQHYAPAKPLHLVETSRLNEVVLEIKKAHKVPGLLLLSAESPRTEMIGKAPYVVTPEDPSIYARNLYSTLRNLDASECDCIVVESVPDSPEWAGIKDRLTRASIPERQEKK